MDNKTSTARNNESKKGRKSGSVRNRLRINYSHNQRLTNGTGRSPGRQTKSDDNYKTIT